MNILELLMEETKEIEFRGETLHIRKLPTLVIVNLSSEASGEENVTSFESNIDYMATVLIHGVEEFDESFRQVIKYASSDLFNELSILQKAVMQFSGLAIADVEEEEEE